MTGGPLLEAALAYAAINWQVFPCWWIESGRCACGSDCKSPGKHPIGQLVPGGQNNATTDIETIRGWWTRYPKANIAVALQASGLCAVDVDPRNGGLETIEQLEAKYGRIESDVMQFTGGGGWHGVCQLQSVVSLPGKLGPGVDMKSNGYIMLEPSNHISGKLYGWEASSDPRDGIVPSPLPDWIRTLANATPQQIVGGLRSTRLIGPTVEQELREALAAFPSDDRDTWVRIGMALRQSGQQGFDLWDAWSRKSAKYDPVDAIRVWNSFKPRGQVNYEAIFAIAQENGWINPMRAPAPEQAPIAATPALVQEEEGACVEPQADHVEAVECPVGIVNLIAGWVTRYSDQANLLVSQAVALSVLATAASRRYISEHGDPASLYLGILQPSASYGRSAMMAAETLLANAGFQEMVRSVRLSSPQQVFSTLYATPAFLYLADDYGDQLRFARRQSSGLLEQALALLGGKIWSAPAQIALDNWAEVGFRKGAEGEGARPIFHRPAVNLLALVSGNQIEQVFKRTEYSRGAVDSMIFIPASNGMHWIEKAGSAPPDIDAPIHETLRRLRGFEPGQTACTREQLFGKLTTVVPAMATVRFTGDLQGAQLALSESYRGRGHIARTLAIGARRNLARLCTVLAAAADPAAGNPCATQPIVDWSTQFIRAMLEATLAAFDIVGGADDNETARPSVYGKVEAHLYECGAEGCSKWDIARYVRAFRDMSTEKRDELLGRMEADRAIASHGVPGRRGVRIVLARFANQQETPQGNRRQIGDNVRLLSKPLISKEE